MTGRTACARGMALVAVLWMLAALSGAALGLSAWVRSEARLRQADVARLNATAAAQAALVHVLAAHPWGGGSPPARQRWTVTVLDTPVQIDWSTAQAAIDINRAPQDLLQAALAHAGGLPPDAAARWAAAIVQTRADPALSGRPAYDAVEDLLTRPGLPFPVWMAVQSLLTVDSDDPALDPQAVDDSLLIVLAQGDAGRAAAWARARSMQTDGDLSTIPAPWIRQTPGNRWKAVAHVQTEDGTFQVTWMLVQGAPMADRSPWRLLRQTVRWVPSG